MPWLCSQLGDLLVPPPSTVGIVYSHLMEEDTGSQGQGHSLEEVEWGPRLSSEPPPGSPQCFSTGSLILCDGLLVPDFRPQGPSIGAGDAKIKKSPLGTTCDPKPLGKLGLHPFLLLQGSGFSNWE